MRRGLETPDERRARERRVRPRPVVLPGSGSPPPEIPPRQRRPGRRGSCSTERQQPWRGVTEVARGDVQRLKMSRSLQVVVAVVLALAVGVALAAYLFNRSRNDEDWKTLKDEASGITVSYPREWAVQTFGPYCRRVGPGLVVSNVGAHTFRNAESSNGCTSQWDLGGLPDDFVLVDVSLSSPVPSSGWASSRILSCRLNLTGLSGLDRTTHMSASCAAVSSTACASGPGASPRSIVSMRSRV